jgi:hypothetical protein
MTSYDRVWSVAVVEGDAKIVFIGRESGALEKHAATSLAQQRPPLLTLPAHKGAITGIVAATPDEVVTCSTDGTLRTWNTAAEVEGKREVKKLQLPAGARCMLASGDAYFVGLANGNIVKIEGGVLSPVALQGHDDAVVALAVSDTGLFSASYDFTARGWDLASGAPQFVFRGHDNNVKGLAVVNGTSLVACGRDDNLFVWNIPAEGPNAGGAGEGAANEGGAEEGGSPAASPAAGGGVIVVEPVGVVELPATPHVLTTMGTQLAVGCSDGSVLGVTAKGLLKAVTEYNASVERNCTQAARAIEQNTAVKVKNAKRIAKRRFKDAKQQLLEAEAAARGEAPSPRRGGGGDEEGEEAEAEAAEGEEPTQGLSPESQAKLDAAKEAIDHDTAIAVAKAQQERAEQLRKVAPLRKQMFKQSRDKFFGCPFATTFRGPQTEPVLALATDGPATVVLGSGSAVVTLPCRVGVQSL